MANTNITFQICTLNVNGLAGAAKAKLLLTQLSNLRSISIFALQETHRATVHNRDFDVFVSPGSARSRGCTFLVRKQFLINHNLRVDNFKPDIDGRMSVISLKSLSPQNKLHIKVVNIYAPNLPSERKSFFNNTIPMSLDLESHIILLGDFNCVLDDTDTTSTSLGKTNHIGKEQLYSLCNTFQLNEGSYIPGTTDRYTWHKPNEQVASRLDRIYKPTAWSLLYICSLFMPLKIFQGKYIKACL